LQATSTRCSHLWPPYKSIRDVSAKRTRLIVPCLNVPSACELTSRHPRLLAIPNVASSLPTCHTVLRGCNYDVTFLLRPRTVNPPTLRGQRGLPTSTRSKRRFRASTDRARGGRVDFRSPSQLHSFRTARPKHTAAALSAVSLRNTVEKTAPFSSSPAKKKKKKNPLVGSSSAAECSSRIFKGQKSFRVCKLDILLRHATLPAPLFARAHSFRQKQSHTSTSACSPRRSIRQIPSLPDSFSTSHPSRTIGLCKPTDSPGPSFFFAKADGSNRGSPFASPISWPTCRAFLESAAPVVVPTDTRR